MKPNFWMQPWTLIVTRHDRPVAAARIFARDLVTEGDMLVDLTLKKDDLPRSARHLSLRTPLSTNYGSKTCRQVRPSSQGISSTRSFILPAEPT